ncbi:PTS lactose/cellobiose transporter subunit IIA [Orbus mooreae]|uniref:PTS lactose/cellobiose transporter subunit IIA n=1 Tax=Orbus mooreae TaxID=3074107 RepID=UPI00370D7DE6
MEQICFELICYVGDARSSFIQAINCAKKGDYAQSEQLIENGLASFNRGHAVHAKLVQAEAEGMTDHLSLLLIHAEDQLMSAETFKILCTEFIALYQKIDSK